MLTDLPEPSTGRARASVPASPSRSITAGVAVLTAGGSGATQLALGSAEPPPAPRRADRSSSAPAAQPAPATGRRGDSKLALPGYLRPAEVRASARLGGRAATASSPRVRQGPGVRLALPGLGARPLRDGGWARETPMELLTPTRRRFVVDHSTHPAAGSVTTPRISAADAEDAARAASRPCVL